MVGAPRGSWSGRSGSGVRILHISGGGGILWLNWPAPQENLAELRLNQPLRTWGSKEQEAVKENDVPRLLGSPALSWSFL